MGSLLCGGAEVIRSARRWRKLLGGGMRQAGMMAAAGLYALRNNIDRLADDHTNARRLHEGLSAIPALEVKGQVDTNMVFVFVPEAVHDPLLEEAGARDIILRGGPQMRLVTHLGIEAEDIKAVIDLFRTVMAA